MPPTPTPVPARPPTGGLPPLSQHLADAITQTLAWCVARPWLATIPVVLLAAGLLGRAVIAGRRSRARNEHAQLITITPPPEVDPAGAGVFWATLTEITTPGRGRRWREGRSHIAVEYRWAGRALTIAVWVPATLQIGPIQAAIRGAWPGSACSVADATAPLPAGGIAVGGALAPTLPAWYPLDTDHDNDPMRTLIAAASGLHAGEAACVQILARPASTRQLRRLRHGVATLRTGKRPMNLLDPASWLRLGLNLASELLGPTRPGRPPQRTARR